MTNMHRLPLASAIKGYTVRISKEQAIKNRRNAEKKKRLRDSHAKKSTKAKQEPVHHKELEPRGISMSVSYIGNGELEGIIESPEVVVHAGNRATLARKATRILLEKHGIKEGVRLPKPSGKIEGVVV